MPDLAGCTKLSTEPCIEEIPFFQLILHLLAVLPDSLGKKHGGLSEAVSACDRGFDSESAQEVCTKSSQSNLSQNFFAYVLGKRSCWTPERRV